MPNKTNQTPGQQQSRRPPNSDVGRDTDGDGRVVQPGHSAGEVDGAEQRRAQGNKTDWIGKDTDGDGRVVKPGRRPGEIDGDRQKQKH